MASPIGLAWKYDAVGGESIDAAHLEVDRGDRLAVDEQAAGPVAITGGHETTVGQQRAAAPGTRSIHASS